MRFKIKITGTIQSTLLFFFIIVPAVLFAGNDKVIVGINRFKDPVELEIFLSSGGVVTGDGEKLSGKITPYALHLRSQKNGTIVIDGGKREYIEIRIAPGREAKLKNPGNGIEYRYTGELSFHAASGLLRIINSVATDEYLVSVICSEMGPKVPLEALKAQAVAARTFLVLNRKKHAKEGFELCDSRMACCQVYTGCVEHDERAVKAVSETDGYILCREGKPIEALFSSCCGGETCGYEAVFPDAPVLPYLRGIKDEIPGSGPLCAGDKRFNWEHSFREETLCAAFADTGRNKVSAETDSSGNVLYMVKGKEKIPVLFFRKNLAKAGFSGIDSNFFTMRENAGIYTFKGHGFGHRLGMCQAGAVELARRGIKFEEILSHYYLADLSQLR